MVLDLLCSFKRMIDVNLLIIILLYPIIGLALFPSAVKEISCVGNFRLTGDENNPGSDCYGL